MPASAEWKKANPEVAARMPLDLAQKIDEVAAGCGSARSDVVREACRDYVATEGLKGQAAILASEAGIKKPDVFEEALRFYFHVYCAAGTSLEVVELVHLAADQEDEIRELRDRVQQLEGESCPRCAGTGAEAPGPDATVEDRMEWAKECQRVISSPAFVPLWTELQRQEDEDNNAQEESRRDQGRKQSHPEGDPESEPISDPPETSEAPSTGEGSADQEPDQPREPAPQQDLPVRVRGCVYPPGRASRVQDLPPANAARHDTCATDSFGYQIGAADEPGRRLPLRPAGVRAVPMNTRAELILAQARRAKTPSDSSLVGRAIAQAAADATHEEMDVLDEALAIARETMDAYLGERVVPIGRPERKSG